MLNNKGLKRLPCGTPQWRGNQLEQLRGSEAKWTNPHFVVSILKHNTSKCCVLKMYLLLKCCLINTILNHNTLSLFDNLVSVIRL